MISIPSKSYQKNDVLEQARIIHLKKPAKIINANIFVLSESKKEVSVRINFYAVENDKPGKRLIEKSIIRKAIIGKGWFSVDLKDDDMVDKILCMCDPDDILDIENKLKDNFPELQIAKSSNILIEINNGGVSKATAIQTFCQSMHIDINHVMAIGDNYNDLTMLESVGYPVVMDNAPLAIKEQFRNHTSSNNDDGVAQAILSNRQ